MRTIILVTVLAAATVSTSAQETGPRKTYPLCGTQATVVEHATENRYEIKFPESGITIHASVTRPGSSVPYVIQLADRDTGRPYSSGAAATDRSVVNTICGTYTQALSKPGDDLKNLGKILLNESQ